MLRYRHLTSHFLKSSLTQLRIHPKKLSRPFSQQNQSTPKHGAFANFYEKTKKPQNINEEKDEDFETLLRNSNFINMGDPEGKILVGHVFHIVNNDLYIDFGWKFHCVCPKPIKNSNEYVRGTQVKLKIKSLELATRFLGSEKDMTLLEADATLLGLYKPYKNLQSNV
ncbi:28S ribosomal protein S28, mitochondrial [Adelges cooleyi]|uniref:28S ribosomal protein S28, mitochondrial n=1 Tax=Adelges cooleyi TaxID=133065 RepID=UPI00217F92B2|nr:28S ribosomal protein S28, mitochondrial [Adelges cooleyi]